MSRTPRATRKPYVSRLGWAKLSGIAAQYEMTASRALETVLDSYARGHIPYEILSDISTDFADGYQVSARISADVWERAEKRRKDDKTVRYNSTLVSQLIAALNEGRLALVVEARPVSDVHPALAGQQAESPLPRVA